MAWAIYTNGIIPVPMGIMILDEDESNMDITLCTCEEYYDMSKDDKYNSSQIIPYIVWGGRAFIHVKKPRIIHTFCVKNISNIKYIGLILMIKNEVMKNYNTTNYNKLIDNIKNIIEEWSV